MTRTFLFRLCVLMILVEVLHAKGSSSSSIAAKKKRAEEKKQADEKACMARVAQCAPVTSSITTNVARALPCVDGNPCMVVVNDRANSTDLCTAWSPYSFWDGEWCLCRCELLGGSIVVFGDQRVCFANGSAIVEFDAFVSLDAFFDGAYVSAYPVSDHLFLAPIKCGTWLGVRDSAANGSSFRSSCMAILENRHDLNSRAKIRPCGVDGFTTGCRVLGSWIPECRNSDAGVCGVMVDSLKLGGFPPACPVLDSCVSDKLDLNVGKSSCNSSIYLALNVLATAANCSLWNNVSFLLDGKCVSSCGLKDYQCEVGGNMVPPCRKTTDGNQNVVIKPDICSVPVRSDKYSGVRNGYFGISPFSSSNCFLSTNCTNASECSSVEGISVTSLQTSAQVKLLPSCRGNSSEICKIGYPCPIIPVPFECKPYIFFNLQISQALWTSMGVYDCVWFEVSDFFVFFCWIVSLVGWCFLNISSLMSESCSLHVFNFMVFLICLGLSCIWGISLPFFICLSLAYAYKRHHDEKVLEKQVQRLDTGQNMMSGVALQRGRYSEVRAGA